MSQRLRAGLSEERQQSIDKAISTAVKFAEQSGIIEKLAGPEKRKQAMALAQRFLKDHGVKMDVEKLGALIEAEVQTQFKQPALPQDTPEARQKLIDSAVQAAILASEQSGMTGLIQNLGPEKKAYAMQMAGQYLAQLGVSIDQNLLSGLIESNLLKTVMGLRGQHPAASPAQQSVTPQQPPYRGQPAG
jgi:hypothetical protein